MLSLQPVMQDELPAQDNLFQTGFWGAIKTACGQQAVCFLAEKERPNDKPLRFPLTVFIRKTASDFIYAYVPRGPSVSVAEEDRGRLLEELSLAVHPWLPENCGCIRFEPAWKSVYSPRKPAPERSLIELRMNFGTETGNLRMAPSAHFCSDTVLINLSLPPKRILAGMRQTTRNCIRRAYKKEVSFAVCDKSPIEEWHKIYTETALRKQFYHENLEYFQRLFSDDYRARFQPVPDGIPLYAPAPDPEFYILTARKEGTLLSGIILALCGKTAYYMYAGSTLEQRELMPNYGLQWESMLFARRKGCTVYDLMGIPPNGNNTHPMAGLYIFKTGFGGEHVRYCGAWDYPYRKQDYERFCMEEQLGTI